MLVGFATVGGSGGEPFEFVGAWKGALIAELQFWASENTIRGVRAKLSDGEEKYFGVAQGASQAYTFQAGERLTSLTLWGNGIGTRAGWIEFHTSAGGFFSFGMTQWGRKTPYKMEVGSGILVGIYGNSGMDIDCLGLAFVDKLKRASVGNVEYVYSQLDALSIVPIDIINRTIDNETSLQQSFPVSQKYTHSDRTNFVLEGALEKSLEGSVELTFEAKIPVVAKGNVKTGAKAGLKLSDKTTTTQEHGNISELTFSANVAVPPMRRVLYTATIWTAILDLDYTAVMFVETERGEKGSFPIRGRLKGARTTDVDDWPREMPLPVN